MMFPLVHGVLVPFEEPVDAILSVGFAQGASAGRNGVDYQWETQYYVPIRQYVGQLEDVSAEITWDGPQFIGLENYEYPEEPPEDPTVEELQTWAQAMADDFNSQSFIDTDEFEWTFSAVYSSGSGSGEQASLVLQYVPQLSVFAPHKRYDSITACVADGRAASVAVTPGYFRVVEVNEDGPFSDEVTTSYGGETGSWSPSFYEDFSDNRNFLSLPRLSVSVEYPTAPTLSEIHIRTKSFSGQYLSDNFTLSSILPEFPEDASWNGPNNKPGAFDESSSLVASSSFVPWSSGGQTDTEAADSALSSLFPQGDVFFISKTQVQDDPDEGEVDVTHTVTFSCIDSEVTSSGTQISGMAGATFKESVENVIDEEVAYTTAFIRYFEKTSTSFEVDSYGKSPDVPTSNDYSYNPGDEEEELEDGTGALTAVGDPQLSMENLPYSVLEPAYTRVYVALPGTPENVLKMFEDDIDNPSYDMNE